MVVVSDETHFQYVLSALGVMQTPPPSGASSLMTGASSGATGSEKLASLISHVKDILPHLGDRFIEVGGKLCGSLGSTVDLENWSHGICVGDN